jgi:hypothetical protein
MTMPSWHYEEARTSRFDDSSWGEEVTDSSTSFRSSGVIEKNASCCLWSHLRGFRIKEERCSDLICSGKSTMITYGHKDMLSVTKVGKEYGIK